MTFKEQLQADAARGGVFTNPGEFGADVSVSADCIEAFDWECTVNSSRGQEAFDPNGDTQTIQRCHATGSTTALVAGGITKLRRDIVVVIGDDSWGVDLATSYWDDYMVQLGLVKNEIARHQEMESRGPVR